MMRDLYLFAEVFPINPGAIPALAAYALVWGEGVGQEKAASVGQTLSERLAQAFGGYWVWLDERIITDNPRTEVELAITLDIIRAEQPKLYAALGAIREDAAWYPTADLQGRFIKQTVLSEMAVDIQAALEHLALKTRTESRAVAVMPLACQLQTWTVADEPAVSISVESSGATLAQQAQWVKTAADVAKNAGVLSNAYNSRDMPEVFLHPNFEANLMFDAKRVRPYKPEKLADDFLAAGVYKRHKAFETGAVRIAVINTLADKVDDFIEALKRLMERKFGFSIALLRERKVKVLSRENLRNAVKVVEGENAHVVLVFVSRAAAQGDSVDAEYLKTLTVGKGMASQIIDDKTLHDPDAMPLVIMGLLGKTGSVPFVLAEPMPYAHFVAGLDIVPEKRKDSPYITGLMRLYRSDGAFLRYTMRDMALDADSKWFVLMRDLFPQRDFAGKRVIIHHSGPLNPVVREALDGWAKAVGAAFYPVEIIHKATPYLYALQNKVIQPPWGSALRLSESEAFLVTSLETGAISPPLYIRAAPPLMIEQALHSVLVWTLLHYGSANPFPLPVTVQHSDVIEAWLAKGTMPEAKDGSIPFWL